MTSETYEHLNKSWKATSKAIFRRDIGDLKEYQDWLGETFLRSEGKSAISGQEVILSPCDYAKDARIITLAENSHPKLKFEPLNINEVKDIDSIIEAIHERIYYTGNVVLGNSSFVERSTNIHDSQFALASTYAVKSKYLAYCSGIRYCESMFGCNTIGNSSNCMRGFHGFKARRCFEFWNVSDSSDCIYSNNLTNSTECIFCFNLWNARHKIGNLHLIPEQYKSVKDKLIEEMATELERKKSLPALVDLFQTQNEADETIVRKEEGFRIEKVNDGFGTTSKILLGKTLGNVEEYEKWLSQQVPTIKQKRSTLSGIPVFISNELPYAKYLGKKVITLEEGKNFLPKIDENGLEQLNLKTAGKILEPIALFTPLDTYGTFSNIGESFDYGEGADNLYRCALAYNTRHAAYSFWPRDSEYEYGCNRAFESKLCIKSYYSTGLTRCFEVDSSRQCSDMYFSHNCENVHESMFCFNSKNLRNAIGNTPFPLERYRPIKNILVDQIADELITKKNLKYGIYNLNSCETNK